MQKLKIQGSYKTLFAALLLALYIFVATPLQYWHQHSHSKVMLASSAEEDLLTFAELNPQTEDCSICDHYFAIHASAISGIYIACRKVLLTYSQNFSVAIVPIGHATQSTRGPPNSSFLSC